MRSNFPSIRFEVLNIQKSPALALGHYAISKEKRAYHCSSPGLGPLMPLTKFTISSQWQHCAQCKSPALALSEFPVLETTVRASSSKSVGRLLVLPDLLVKVELVASLAPPVVHLWGDVFDEFPACGACNNRQHRIHELRLA